MKFVNPYLLNLLWFLIVVFGIMVYGMLKREKVIKAFAKRDMLLSIAPGFNPKRRWVRICLILFAAGFAIVALAGPRAGFRWEKVEQKGVDIMIALDCSKSMLARDIKPSRLARAKREIIDLLRMMKSDRAGLVAFSGRAILQCPLTLDHEAFNIFLNVLEPGFLPMGGTNLEEAIKTSYEGFEKQSDTQKAIILITDGEITSGNYEKAAREMAKSGVKIFCIGVGDLQGAPIPDDQGGFKKDDSGNIILSKVDEKGLKKIASITGGTYVRSVAGDMDLDLIYTDKILGTMERRALSSGRKKIWENRYQWFLLPCVLLLLTELTLSVKNKKNRLPIFILTALACSGIFQPDLSFAGMISSSVKQGIQAFETQQYEKAKTHFIDAQLEKPEDKRLYYNIGTAAYMNKEFDQAEKNFIQAARTKDLKLKYDALYNLANTRYRLGKFDEAIKGYAEILTRFPEDTQARENLEFVKKKKAEQDKKDKKDKQDQKKKDQKKKDQDRKNQNKKDKDKNKDKDKKNQAQKKQDQKKPDKDKKNQDRSSQTEQNQTDSGIQQADKGRPDARKNIDNKLNRLKDKPGRAMMPVVQKQIIEKDW